MAGQRDPQVIQKEIEQTRAQLAETIDSIAERISPRRAASRSAQAMKAQVTAVFGGGGANGHSGSNGNGHRGGPASVLDAPPAAAAQRQVQQIAEQGGGAAYTGTSQFRVGRRLRTDRVLLVVGVAAAVAGVIVLRRTRR